MLLKNERQIGEGTYGKVFSGQCSKTGRMVAIKRVGIESDYGLPFTTVREIRMLKKLQHSNIVKILDVQKDCKEIVLVFEYVKFDLSGLVIRKYRFSESQIGSIAYQLLSAVAFMHKSNIVHRDIKTSNILINGDGVIKLADMGLCRRVEGVMTNNVCTLWYRAPEILLGATDYSLKVDCWSVGCVLIEIKTHKVIFCADSEVGQIQKILSILGHPKIEYPWSYIFKLTAKEDEVLKNRFITFLLNNFDQKMLHLVLSLLSINVDQRISAQDGLNHPAISSYADVFVQINFEDAHEYTARAK